MPRSLALGNGSLLVTFDQFLQMRDVYFPHVGEEDHTTYGHFHRIGFRVGDRGFTWTNDGSWEIEPGYVDDTLVTRSFMRHRGLGIEIRSEDVVDPSRNILLRTFFIRSTDGPKRVQCFFHHDFHLYGDKQKETAFYEPHTKSVIHYRDNRYFLIGGTTDKPVSCMPEEGGGDFHPFTGEHYIEHCGITSYAVGKAHYQGLEGTWKDAEDGVLGRNSIDQGSVDSTVEIDCVVDEGAESTVTLWMCAGKKINEVHDLQHFLLDQLSAEVMSSARQFWKGWVHAHEDPGAYVPADIGDLYRRSLLLIRTQADNGGGIVAACDSDIMQFNRDTYTYVWPRDGAFVSMALTACGEREVTERFLRFCARVQTKEGYFLHKYNPDGSPGSSWHPWFRDGKSVLPIQCDETALPIVALWRHFERNQDVEFLHELFHDFVCRGADFLIAYSEPDTGLPLQSYDLWEEHRAVHTFTVATTVAALRAAGDMAAVLGHRRHSERYHDAADKMNAALLYHLFDEKAGHFVRRIKREDGVTVNVDSAVDASLMLLWKFGVLPPSDPRFRATMEVIERELTVPTGIGGIARYANDWYQSPSDRPAGIPGNPWIITTLWLAQWKIAVAEKPEDLAQPLEILRWAKTRASSAGILAEQMHPVTGAPLSVAPLTWSHAVYAETVIQYAEAARRLGVTPLSDVI